MRASSWLVIGGAVLTLGGMAAGSVAGLDVMRAGLAAGVPAMVLGVCLADDSA